MVFFSKNLKTARARIKKLARTEKLYKGKDVRLSKTQISHIQGWKTWKIVKRK